MNNEFVSCIKIRENNNSNVEYLMRCLASYLMMRGIKFIHDTNKSYGSELIIFSNPCSFLKLIGEANDFTDNPPTREWLMLYNSPNTEEVEVCFFTQIRTTHYNRLMWT